MHVCYPVSGIVVRVPSPPVRSSVDAVAWRGQRRRRPGLPGMPGSGGRTAGDLAGGGRAGADRMRTLTTAWPGSSRLGPPGEAARARRPGHRRAVACGEETSISPSQRPPATSRHTRGLAPDPAGTSGPIHRHVAWSRRPPSETAAVRAEPVVQPTGPIGVGSVPRGRAWRSSSGCRHAARRSSMYLPFSACISCSGPRAAPGPASGPVPGSGADRCCRSAGAAPGRAPA